ncbi:LLM class flavin-dependent oxidoreductase [Actinosynnema sp. NPDC020468]|uniref:LLM class flavin-dependent oxidoreductase n=1 Tax=Actinosynnema sp. NPDC020468 TaxID=3154488 RepID=UPI0033C7419B
MTHLGVRAAGDDVLDVARAAERAKLDFVLSDDLTALAAASAVTTRLGLVAEVDSAGHEPYDLARRLQTLDLLSAGRAGWTDLASDARATEFRAVLELLWDSWSADDLPTDPTAGRFVRPGAGEFTHRGEHFDVVGRFSTPRGPQGRPVSLAGLDVLVVEPDAVEDTVRRLRAENAFRAEYAGVTLREHLGAS